MEINSTILILIQMLLSVLGFILWVIFTDVKNQAKQTQKELADYKVQVAKEYASREEVDKLIASFNRTIEQHSMFMNERFNKLEGLSDRMRDKE